ncbi:MAG: hypothetical protein GF363_08295 [Chitinivibrionales bacterium]|nr:hypothetical protein [Chitinivibrionales bacterium]
MVNTEEGDRIRVVARAYDDVQVLYIELIFDGQVIGRFTRFPFWNWHYSLKADIGHHTLVARAYDFDGNEATSEVVNFAVGRRPRANMVNPNKSIECEPGVDITLQAEALSPEELHPVKIDFFYNGFNHIAETSEPFKTVWNVGAPGSYAISARITDALGESTFSKTVTVKAGEGDDVISLNLGKYHFPDYVEMGLHKERNWNNIYSSSFEESGIIYNNRGEPTDMSFWSNAHSLFVGEVPFYQNEVLMMHSFKATTNATPCSVSVKDVPFEKYYIYAFWGGYQTQDYKSYYISIGMEDKTFYFRNGPFWCFDYIPAWSTEWYNTFDTTTFLIQRLPTYAVFGPITEKDFTVWIESRSADGMPDAAPVGFNGIQIVDAARPQLQQLRLTSMCSTEPSLRRWRVRNPNDRNVKCEWDVVGTKQSGAIMAAPGDNFFFTKSVEGPNTTRIRWYDNEHTLHHAVKASSGAICQNEFDLHLTSMCSTDPEKRRWRVRNANSRDIQYQWEVVGTMQSGTGIAAPGDTFFFTESVSGPNTTRITWEDIAGLPQHTVKASSGAICE